MLAWEEIIIEPPQANQHEEVVIKTGDILDNDIPMIVFGSIHCFLYLLNLIWRTRKIYYIYDKSDRIGQDENSYFLLHF